MSVDETRQHYSVGGINYFSVARQLLFDQGRWTGPSDHAVNNQYSTVGDDG